MLTRTSIRSVGGRLGVGVLIVIMLVSVLILGATRFVGSCDLLCTILVTVVTFFLFVVTGDHALLAVEGRTLAGWAMGMDTIWGLPTTIWRTLMGHVFCVAVAASRNDRGH